MNYNPFSKKLFSRKLARYPKKLNIFDRLVGRPDSMGIFDYLFVAPFIFKQLFDSSKGIRPLRIIFGIITAPIAIAKFFLFIAVSPLVLLGYGIKALVKLGVKKHQENKISDYMKSINELMVENPKNPNGKPVTLATALGHPLVNKDINRYSICTNAKNQLVLKTFPGSTQKAVFIETRDNVSALSKLTAKDGHNRLSYFMKYAYRDIFDYNANQKIAQVRQKLRDDCALSSVMLLNHLIVRNRDQDSSFSIIDRDVRLIIVNKVLEMEKRSPSTTGIFKNFSGEEMSKAIGFYDAIPPAAKKR